MSTDVTIKFDKEAVKARLKGASGKAVFITAEQIRKDSNQYCPDDQDPLIDSSNEHSILEDGLIVWSSDYARYQYYGVTIVGTKPKTPTDIPLKYSKANAHMMWAHYARSQHGKQWEDVFQKAFTAELRNK